MEGLFDDRAARVLDASPEAIMAIDARGTVAELNRAAERLLERSRDVTIGRPVSELVTAPEEAWSRTGGPTGALVRLPGDRGELAVELLALQTGDEPALRTATVRPSAADQGGKERLLAAAESLVRMGSWERDLRTGDSLWSDELHRLLGLEPRAAGLGDEAFLAYVHPDDRDRIARALRSVLEDPASVPEHGEVMEYRIVREDGTVRSWRALGRIERDGAGGPVRFVGSVQDVTEQRLSERQLEAHYTVSQALRDWESFDEGIVDLLRRLGTALEYPLGSLWLWSNERGALVCRAFWHVPSIDPAGFEAAQRRLAFRSGEGTPGRAWQTKAPVATSELPDPPRARLPGTAGVQAALAFPAIGPEGLVAVLSFYAFERREAGESLLRTLRGIGADLGLFLHGRRAQLEPQRLTARELEVLRLAAGGVSGPAIAERLVLSPATIKTHFEHVYDKLGVSDRAAAVAEALRTGLIE